MSLRTMLAVLSSIALVTGALPVIASQALAADVTPERLTNTAAEPQNWLMIHRDYDNSRHSPLNQINRDTIKNLELKYTFSIGGRTTGGTLRGKEESTPLVDDGFMYVTDTWSRVMKFDVRSGKEAIPLWRYDPKIRVSRTTRGLAMYGNAVVLSTYDARIIALNRDNGEVLWEINAMAPMDPNTGTPSKTQAFSGAPLTIKTKGGRELVVQGESTGGSLGTRSWIGGFDVKTGALAWRTFTIPAPGEPGSETWKDNHNAWRIGGAGVWQTASYDPATNLLYYGTGDAFPTFDPEFRPGDNLYTASTLALDADTGKIVWYFQETPNEHWDFDTPSPKMLYETTINGEPRKVVANFSRNGFYYTLDRASGQFLRADQYRKRSPGPRASTPRPASRSTTTLPSPFSAMPASASAAASRGKVLPMVFGLADLLPADLRRQAHDRLCVRRRGLLRRHHRADPDGREEGLGRPAHVLPGAGPRHRSRRAVGRGRADRQDRRQGAIPDPERIRHALDRRRFGVHRPFQRAAGGV